MIFPHILLIIHDEIKKTCNAMPRPEVSATSHPDQNQVLILHCHVQPHICNFLIVREAENFMNKILPLYYNLTTII